MQELRNSPYFFEDFHSNFISTIFSEIVVNRVVYPIHKQYQDLEIL